MKQTSLVCAFILLVAVAGASAASAAASAQPAAPPQQVASGNLTTLPMELRAQDDQAAPTAASRQGKPTGSYLLGGGFQDTALACTWYDISCSNGTTDQCCGSESSCLSYCGEVCGETCIVAN